MASDYTTNFNLDKYVATDKPNLRDQYNSAMDKIDAQLKIDSDNAALAVQTANNAASAVSGKASQSALDALAAIIPDTDFSSSSTVKNALDAKASTSYVNSEISRISGYGTNLTGKKVLCIGDSLTHHTPVAKWWPQYLAENTGCTTYNFAVGGTGFLTGNPTFIQQLQNAHNSSSFNDSDITDIIICGGYNDYQQIESSLKSAVASCITYARATFVNATIHIGAMLHGTLPLDTGQNRSKLIAPIHDACMEGNCCWIDGCWYWCVGYDGIDFGDGIHTNPAGQNVIAGYMASHLNGGSTDRIISVPNIAISPDAQPWVTSLNLEAFAKNGIITVNGNFTFRASDSTTVFSSEIARLPKAFCRASSLSNPACTITTEQYFSTPAQGSRVYLVSPRAFLWNNSNNMQVLSVQQLSATVYNTMHFISISYPFGL